MDSELEIAARLGVAALAGLAVGIEREWSGHATGPHARFAGARTFLLLGFVGGMAGWLLTVEWDAAATVLLAGAALLAVAAFVVAARAGGEAVDGTTEAAVLAVLAVALMAGLGHKQLAAGAAAVMVVVLREKGAIHRFVTRIGDIEMRAALQFAVLALVLLPLLPEGPYGPYGGIEPRKLWMVVLFLTGLNFAGYLARRAFGSHQGYAITGLLGGLSSSTATTLTFARQSRTEPAAGEALAFGVVGACTVLLPRVLVISLALNPPLAAALLPFTIPPLLTGAAMVVLGLRTAGRPVEVPEPELQNPLRLGAAVVMALALQVALTLVAAVRQHIGETGVLPTAALLGLTDMDALTLSMNRLGQLADQLPLAARAIAIGIVSNTTLKLAAAIGLGRGRFRPRVVAGLGILGLASIASLWLFW
ncbi:MAG TPA: DUF4010 domain-containing protein [Gemmatimonadales bacterium]|nr:DUF4010 domain-containing protein [Gemmatimonadales bacterium]